MHENREISSTPWSDEQGRSAKATSRNADTHVPEKFGLCRCTCEPAEQGRATFRGGRGGKGTDEGEHRSIAHARHRAGSACPLGRRCLKCQPSSRTGENPPYGMIGGTVETSASFEARYAPLS